MVRGQLADIISGTVLLFMGLATCGVAAMRRRSGVGILIWLGIWSAMYGVGPLLDSLDALAHLPHWLHVSIPYVRTVAGYLVLVVATRAFLELTLGKMRTFAQAVIFAGLAIGVAGLSSSSSRDRATN